MNIYGVALLAFCFLLGKLIGSLLGQIMQINGDMGGVGFAMLFLILGNAYFKRKGWMVAETQNGILFGAQCIFQSLWPWQLPKMLKLPYQVVLLQY